MTVQRDDRSSGRGLMAVGVVPLALALFVGIALYDTGLGAADGEAVPRGLAARMDAALAASEMVAPVSEVITAKGVGAIAEIGASVQIEGDTVRFQFGLGETRLGKGAMDALADIVRGVAAGRTAVISGYPDGRGDPAYSEVLAGQRALAVQDALMELGIGEDKIELRRPETAVDGADEAWARRVDVTLDD